MSVVIFIIILVALILVHEFGHFIAAKAMRMRVDEFGIGFPPRLFSFRPKRGETTYSVNAIPFGGFVKIFGEDPSSGEDDPRSFSRRPRAAQAAVIVAGVAFNILFAWALITWGFLSGMPMPVGSIEGASVENPRLVITAVSEGSPADRAGLRPGDEILALVLPDRAVQGDELTPSAVSRAIAEAPAYADILYKRGDERALARAVPEEGIIPDRAAIGITMDVIGTVTLPVFKAIYEAGKTTVSLTWATVRGFAALIANAFSPGAGPGLAAITGPVGIAGLVGDAADFGFVYLLGFTALISINLAVINLIPFPALDGGRLFFLLIEAVKRSPIKPAVASAANTIGFLILIALMIAVTYNDIMRLVG